MKNKNHQKKTFNFYISLLDFARNSAVKALGKSMVFNGPMMTASEDFAYCGQNNWYLITD